MKNSRKIDRGQRNTYIIGGLFALFVIIFVVCASLGLSRNKTVIAPESETIPSATEFAGTTLTPSTEETESIPLETTTESMPESDATSSEEGEATPISVSAALAERPFYIGSELSGADFVVSVTMSDGTVMLNPPGWNAVPLVLTEEVNSIIISYEGLSTVVTVNAEPAPTPVVTADNLRFVFLGDSRFVALQNISNNPTDTFFAEVGEGYYFLEKVKEAVIADGTPESALVFGLGVNDGQWFIPQYIEAINDIAARYPGRMFFTTVNPIDEVAQLEYGYHKENAIIDDFNAQLLANLAPNITVIDTSAYLKNKGCTWADGLHFTKETNIDVYNYIKEAVLAAY